MPYHKFVQNFNGGELSPFLSNRTDVAKYESGCQVLENMIILPYGGVMRRPGTQYLGAAKLANRRCRLIGFNFSVTTNFILELGHKYIRFWTNGVQVQLPARLNTEAPTWKTNTNYLAGSYVKQSSARYRCLRTNYSATFSTDLSAGLWVSVNPTAAAAWVTGHAYAVGDLVQQGGASNEYECLIAHTSGTFSTDKNAGKWKQVYRLAQSGPLEIISPYAEADLRQVQYCQINDLMYMCHPLYGPLKLVRRADDYWVFGEFPFKWPALLDENITSVTITPSATTGDGITLTASDDLFTEDDVGATWQIGHNMAGANNTWTEVALGNASADSPQLRVRGSWSLTTYGTWSGEVRVIRQIIRTGVTETIRTYHNTTDGQRNVSTTGTEDEDCYLNLKFITGGTAGSSNPLARIEFSNAKVYGLVKIIDYVTPTSVVGDVKWDMARATATAYWSEGAFSDKQGHPRAACLHESRLYFAGTKKRPLSIHGSQIDDYENFQRGSGADVGLFFTLSANESNPIQWMVSQTKLLIGTAGNEWSLGATNTDQAMGPGNVQARQQSNFGSAYLQSRSVNEVVLFAQRQGLKIRELTYSFQKDGWVAPDLTILAAHIGDTGFAETAFAAQPDAIFWCVTLSGNLVGMTYERDQNVVGWHRHTTQGVFESVASIYGGSKADEIWLSVQRTANGAPVRYIERFDPNFRPTLDAEDKKNYWYLDCGFRSGGTTEVDTVSGISHLEGCTVGILGDGANQPTRVVAGGSVTIQEPAKLILVGLPYSSHVKPMSLNIPVQDTMQGRKVRIHKAVVRFYKSLTCKFSTNGDKWNEIFFRDRDDLMDTSPSVYTGDREIHTGASYTPQQAITLKQDRPFPLCCLAMIYWADSYGE